MSTDSKLCPKCNKEMTFIPAREKCTACQNTYKTDIPYWVCLDCSEVIPAKK